VKKVEAYIKSQRLTEVLELLHEIEGLTGMSTHPINGFGRTRGEPGIHIVDTPERSVAHHKVEVVCRDELYRRVVEAIKTGAHTGLRSDGKIYVYTVEEAIRISTGEEGERAV
jgi:nitrogen regulatory protein PII